MDDVDYENLVLLSNAEDHAEYNLYVDDGYCTEFDMTKSLKRICIGEDGDVAVSDSTGNKVECEIISMF